MQVAVEIHRVRQRSIEFEEWTGQSTDVLSRVSVTEWPSCEGFDITVEAKGRQESFSLTTAQWAALQVVMGSINLPRPSNSLEAA